MLAGNSSQQRQCWHEEGQDCSARPGLLLWSGQLHGKLQSLQWQEEDTNKLLRKDVLWVTSLRAARFGAYRMTTRQSKRTVLLEIRLQEKRPPSNQHKCHSCWWKTFSNNNNETLSLQGMTHKVTKAPVPEMTHALSTLWRVRRMKRWLEYFWNSLLTLWVYDFNKTSLHYFFYIHINTICTRM